MSDFSFLFGPLCSITFLLIMIYWRLNDIWKKLDDREKGPEWLDD